jgi:DNA-directed RNA polymerase beta subunit
MKQTSQNVTLKESTLETIEKIKQEESREISTNIKQQIDALMGQEMERESEKKTQNEKESEKETEEKTGIFDHYPNYEEESQIITDAYYKTNPLERLVRHQLESYNYFIHFQAHQTIQMFNPLVCHIPEDLIPGTTDKYFLEVQMTLNNMRYQPPQIYETNGATKLLLPSEARLRNFTYGSNTTVDITVSVTERGEDGEIVRTYQNVLPNISMNEMPIMVKSSLCMLTQNRSIGTEYTGECPMDCGGYFIIKGSEKAVLGQERAAENKIYCFDGKNTAKWQWVAEIKSVPDFKPVSPKQVEMMVSKKDNGYGFGIFVCIPKLKPKYSVELFSLFRALGVITDKAICEYILLDVEDDKQAEILEFLHASVVDSKTIVTQEDAIKHIMSMVSYVPMMAMTALNGNNKFHANTKEGVKDTAAANTIGGASAVLSSLDEERKKEWAAYGYKKKWEFTTELLNNDVLPHCRNLQQKLYMLGYMARRIIYISKGWIKPDNRDSYVNKRIDLPGTSLNNLFRIYYHRMTKDMIKATNKEIKQGTWRSHDDIQNIINMSNIYKIVKPSTIKTGMIRALATGDFSTKQANSNKVGVAQVLNRLTYQATLSHLRRINTPTDKSSEMIDPRKLHGTQWGFLCLTGDVDVLLSNRVDTKKIKDIQDGEWVNTVHREKLVDEPSDMFRKFGKMPDKLYEITTASGRKIKATADHPFLVKGVGETGYVMKKVSELEVGVDKVIIRPSVLPISDTETNNKRKQISEILSQDEFELVFDSLNQLSISTLKPVSELKWEEWLSFFQKLNIRVSILSSHASKPPMLRVTDVEKFLDYIDFSSSETKRKQVVPMIELLKMVRFSGKECVNLTVLGGGCVSIPLISITEIEPEMVYDFTTRSENHSFVASSFVVSNCPIETPEGSSIGLVKNLSSHTHVTIPGNSSSLYEYLRPNVLFVEDAKSPKELHGKAKVFINGVWMGVVVKRDEMGNISNASEYDVQKLFHSLKEKKARGIINIYTSILFDYVRGEIRLCNDGGRLTRPVLRVRDGKALITPEIVAKLDKGELQWNDLLTNCKIDEAVIEYIDPEEQSLAMMTMHDCFLTRQTSSSSEIAKEIAMTMKNYERNALDKIRNQKFMDFSEIHPQTLLGILASCIPFPEHNPAARDIYQTAMAKQAMGFGALNYDQRMEKTAYVLNSPTRPLVDTRLMNSIHLDRMPAGCEVHVAIMTYTGYNQEDSVILNEGAIKRGLFATTVYHTERDEDNNVVRDEIIRSKPNPAETKGMKFANYDKLGKNGFVPVNTLLDNRDVLIAKIFPIKENRADNSKKIKFEDQSKVFRSTEPAYVDRNLTGRNGEGANFGKTTIRIYRPPVIGDKFASRSAQKGTTGLIVPEADMPFTKDGIKPDIILNPHAIPSRMTISHIKETLLGKVLIELGIFGDGTAFGNLDVRTICSALQNLGYESHGNEVLYDGLTGEQIETSIYIGPVFYQRLKHMVNDKQHSRSVGVGVNFTRQPAEGRSREGGFRVGEMEKDVLVAHGGTKFFRERMYDMSDKYGLYVCRGCGMYGAVNEGEGPWNEGARKRARGGEYDPDFKQYLCNVCDNRSDFAYVEVPYTFKLLQQELQAMNVGMRLVTEG